MNQAFKWCLLLLLTVVVYLSCNKGVNNSFVSCRCATDSLPKVYGLGFYTVADTAIYRTTCYGLQLHDTLFDTCVVTRGAY